MPREKKEKVNVDWKLYKRENLGANATRVTAGATVPTTYVTTLKKKEYMREWVEKNGKTDEVYILEKWINGRRVDKNMRYCYCEMCGICDEWKQTFQLKYAWNKFKGWRVTNYSLPTEKKDVKPASGAVRADS